MSSCILNTGYQTGCRDGLGGVQEFYIGTYDKTNVFTLGTYSNITAITGTTVSYYTFQQPPQVGSVTTAFAANTENQTSYYTMTIQLALAHLTPVNADIVGKLGRGRFRIIALDNLGQYWMLGQNSGCYVTANTPGLGKSYGDLNGAMITFEAMEPNPMTPISQSVALQFIV